MTTNESDELRSFLEARNALLRNPTLEAATLWWRGARPRETLTSPLVPFAAVHKARLQWLDATDAMLQESAEWLQTNGFAVSTAGATPLTPETRDAQRKLHGKAPLKGIL